MRSLNSANGFIIPINNRRQIMKKFLLTLAAVAIAASTMLAQEPVNSAKFEQPDRAQMRELSKDPSGIDMATGMQQVKHECNDCKDHKPGQPCTKPADQQCDACKAQAAAAQRCEKGEGHKCEKGEGHKCEKGEGHKCEKGEGHKCEKGESHKCKKVVELKHECKDHKPGQPCNKPADQQCDDCKAATAKKK